MTAFEFAPRRGPRAPHRALAALLCFALGAAHAAPVWADTADKGSLAQENKRVRELFRKGSKALEARKYHEALRALEEAWAIRQTYDVAAALAQVESELGHYVSAASYLEFCLKNIAPAESEQTLFQLQQAFEEVKRHTAVLRITVDREGAEVSVGERKLGTAPLASDVYVEPGAVVVRARHGGQEVSDTVVAEAGGQYALELSFALVAPPPAPAEQEPVSVVTAPPVGYDRVSRGGRSPSLVPVVTGGTLFLIGVGTGLGLHFAAASNENDADKIRKRTGSNGCSMGSADPADCTTLQSLAKSQDRNRNLSTAGFVVAGAALVGTATYWFWPRDKREARASATRGASALPRIDAVAAPGFANITLSGQF